MVDKKKSKITDNMFLSPLFTYGIHIRIHPYPRHTEVVSGNIVLAEFMYPKDAEDFVKLVKSIISDRQRIK